MHSRARTAAPLTPSDCTLSRAPPLPRTKNPPHTDVRETLKSLTQVGLWGRTSSGAWRVVCKENVESELRYLSEGEDYFSPQEQGRVITRGRIVVARHEYLARQMT